MSVARWWKLNNPPRKLWDGKGWESGRGKAVREECPYMSKPSWLLTALTVGVLLCAKYQVLDTRYQRCGSNTTWWPPEPLWSSQSNQVTDHYTVTPTERTVPRSRSAYRRVSIYCARDVFELRPEHEAESPSKQPFGHQAEQARSLWQVRSWRVWHWHKTWTPRSDWPLGSSFPTTVN